MSILLILVVLSMGVGIGYELGRIAPNPKLVIAQKRLADVYGPFNREL
jgi:hypothetical protein